MDDNYEPEFFGRDFERQKMGVQSKFSYVE